MPEILQPTLLERLQICQEDIRDFADRRDDIIAVRDMARVATASIVPEVSIWQHAALRLKTERVLYALNMGDGHDHEILDEPFVFTGTLMGGSLVEKIEAIDNSTGYSEYYLCLRFAPQIESEQPELVLAESALVPVSAIVPVSDTTSVEKL